MGGTFSYLPAPVAKNTSPATMLISASAPHTSTKAEALTNTNSRDRYRTNWSRFQRRPHAMASAKTTMA